MKSSDLITSKEALEVLGLHKSGNWESKLRYLNWLNQRGLLINRFKLTGRQYAYSRTECEALLNKAISEGIILTLNPNQKKQAA